jgi:hypothetical protein
MDIVDALTAHHGVLRQLYEESKTNPDRFDEFLRHLIVHHTMEEKYFYDLLEHQSEGRHDALEAVNEHHIIELIIKDAERFPRDHEQFDVKVEGLGEYTNHHLDEEEMDIFPEARALFNEEDRATLGELFQKAKEMILSVRPPELPRSLADRLMKEEKSQKAPAAGSGAADAPAPEKRSGVGLGIGSLKDNK